MLIKSIFMKIYGIVASIGIIIILLLVAFPPLKPKYGSSVVTFSTDKGEISFDVEIANTTLARTIGLMNRTELPEKSGMLFVFDTKQAASFWMKNTLIPLDMLFISEDKKIVNIKRDAQPCKTLDCQTYSSLEPVRYILEINGGLADKLGIEEGQNVEIKL